MDPSARAPARAGAAGRPAEEAGTNRPAALDLEYSLKQHINVVLHARDTSYFRHCIKIHGHLALNIVLITIITLPPIQ